MWEDKIWTKALTADEGYNLMLREYELNRDGVIFNYNQFCIHKIDEHLINISDEYLINISNDDIKDIINILSTNFELYGGVKAWVDILNLEFSYRRKLKIKKIISNIK
jgi:hypothetical protein